MEILNILQKNNIKFNDSFVFEVSDFTEKYRSELLSKIGVYIFSDKQNTPLYVGYSVNLDGRIFSHLSGKTNTQEYFNKFYSVQIVYLENVTTARIAEMILIKELKTLMNKDNVGIEKFEEVLKNKEQLIKENAWLKVKEISEYKLKSKLKIALIKADIKQKDLADKLGESRQLVNAWASGISQPSLIKAFRISRILGVDMNELWSYEKEG